MQEQDVGSMSSADKKLNMSDIRDFYINKYTPVHDALFANAIKPSVRLRFEITSAFDQLMQTNIIDSTDPTYQKSLEKALGHLKLATSEGFKQQITFWLRTRWNSLKCPCYKDVDNGTFIPYINGRLKEMKKIRAEAYEMEHSPKTTDDSRVWDKVFDKWMELKPISEELNAKYESDEVQAARQQAKPWIRKIGIPFVLSFVAKTVLQWLIKR